MFNLNETINIAETDDHDDLSCARIKKIIKMLNTTIPLMWVIVGTITNGLSLIIFSRKSMRRNSTFFYLALMTLSDFIVIWVGSFRDFLAYKFHIYVSGTLICRLHVFTFFLCCQLSSWLLTAANFDRFVFVLSYNYSKSWCTKKNALRIAIALLVILISINLHFILFIYSNDSIITSSNNKTEIEQTIHPIVYPLCQTRPGIYSSFYAKYYSWIDSFVFSFIPFLIMLVCNIALVTRVFKTKRNLHRYERNRQESTIPHSDQLNQNEPVNESSILSKHRPSAYLTTSEKNEKTLYPATKTYSNSDSTDKMRNMAITIIGVTLLFIIFTVPINIYVPIMHASHQNDPAKSKCDDLIFCILNNMVNANHSISFFIYLSTNSKFKKEIKILLSKIKKLLTRNFNVFMLCCGFNLNCRPDEDELKELPKTAFGRSVSQKKNRASVTSFSMTTYEQTRNNSVYVSSNGGFKQNGSNKLRSFNNKKELMVVTNTNDAGSPAHVVVDSSLIEESENICRARV